MDTQKFYNSLTITNGRNTLKITKISLLLQEFILQQIGSFMSLSNISQIREGLTYDDVLLVPAYSQVLPKDVVLTSKLTRNIEVKTPIIAAAMDTVTEANLAISIAQQGGIGVVHKNMTIAEQALHVRKVKRSESGMILDPVTLEEDATVADALKLMKENKIGGIPVVDNNNHLQGIVTNRGAFVRTGFSLHY